VSRSAALAALAGLAAALGGLSPAGEPPGKERLTLREERRIYNYIDSCTSVEIGLAAIRKHVQDVVGVARGRDSAVNYIVKHCLTHEEPLARLAAVEALGQIGNERALAALHELIMFDGTYAIRRHAARAVAGFGDPVALNKLFREAPDFDGSLGKRIRGPEGESPAAAARRAKRLRDLGAAISRALDRFPSLIRYMRPNEDRDVQERAKRELQRLTGDVDRVAAEDWRKWWKQDRKGRPPALHADINRSADRTTMMALIELAAMIKVREAIAGLVPALRHGEAPVKMAAADALGRLGTGGKGEDKKRIADALREALDDPSGGTRAAAARALTACDAENSAAAFRKLLADWAPGDSSPSHRAALTGVRRAAVAGLRAAKARGVEAELARLLLGPGAGRLLKWEVVAALGELGSPSELPALARYAASGDARERDHAVAAMAAVIARRPPGRAGEGKKLADMSGDELAALARSGKGFLAAAAVYEMDRRGTSLAGAGLLAGPRPAPAGARMLAVALLARRKWTPAVQELAAAALGSTSSGEPDAALAACRAAAEVGGSKAAADFLKSPPAAAKRFTARDIAERRRKAVGSLLGMLRTPRLRPRLAAAAADALAAVLPAEEAGLRLGVVEGLVAALGEERLREARPEIAAALRQLTDEDYPDDPKPWRIWWKKESDRGRKKRPGGGAGG